MVVAPWPDLKTPVPPPIVGHLGGCDLDAQWASAHTASVSGWKRIDTRRLERQPQRDHDRRYTSHAHECRLVAHGAAASGRCDAADKRSPEQAANRGEIAEQALRGAPLSGQAVVENDKSQRGPQHAAQSDAASDAGDDERGQADMCEAKREHADHHQCQAHGDQRILKRHEGTTQLHPCQTNKEAKS